MNDESICIVIGFFFALLLSMGANDYLTIDTKRAISGKDFIYFNATYQCKKTNELKAD